MTADKDSKKWFAIYVRSRNEKKVSKTLNDIGIESFLPLITAIDRSSYSHMADTSDLHVPDLPT